MQKYDGFPLGSMVLHATDDTGRPILAISSLSPHTKVMCLPSLHKFNRCSLRIELMFLYVLSRNETVKYLVNYFNGDLRK